jgi:hypothetical protein
MVRQEHFYYIQQAISTTQVSSLLADMRKSLDADLNLARRYLDQLSALFEEETDIGVPGPCSFRAVSASMALRQKVDLPDGRSGA